MSRPSFNGARHAKRKRGIFISAGHLRNRRLAERCNIFFCHDGETGFKMGSHKHADKELIWADARLRSFG